MKKHLFLIASVFATLSLQAQTVVSVARDTGVKVKENTLFYIGGEMKVNAYSNGTEKKVSNDGKIKITKKLTNLNNDGSNFVNEYFGTGKYGQLIINSEGGDNVGKISSEVKFNSKFNFQTLAIPYMMVEAKSFVKEAFTKKAKNGLEIPSDNDVIAAFIGDTQPAYFPDRYKNPLFYWNNDDYTLDNLSVTDNLNNPERTYTVSTFSSLGSLSTNSETTLSGVPSKGVIPVSVSSYVPGPHNKSTNKYGEAYGSYIEDFTKEMPDGWEKFYVEGPAKGNANDYGANIYYFGNPYTSNIDLSKGEGFVGGKVEAIYQNTSNNYDTDRTVATASYNIPVVAVTGQGAGDPALYVRPFQTFRVKLNLNKGETHNFKFKNEMKVFDLPEESIQNTLFSKSVENMPVINQVGLDLYDTNGFTGVKTYVVASDIYEAAQQGEGTEIYNLNIKDGDTGIYTLQENEDGSVSEKLANAKTYINGVNADKYIAKPVHVVFQNGKGKYTLKARLNESLENNKSAFYFEDKATGKVQKITKDFEYTFNVNGTEKDRFVLYWAATPNKEKVEEVAKEEINTTVVFRDADTYKVRFDKGIKKADVFVYNISGQLVNTARNIDTSVDYIVPLRGNSSVYIVKVVGDNGQVVTKKIIK